MNWKLYVLAFCVACAVVVFGAAVVAGSGSGAAPTEEPSGNNETETPGGHVADSPAYENASCVPGLVGDGTGCLDDDQAPPVTAR